MNTNGDKLNTSPLIDRYETADLLNVSVRSIDRMASSQQLRRIKVRGCTRFHRSEVENLVKKGGTNDQDR